MRVYTRDEIIVGNVHLLQLADYTETFQQSVEAMGYDQHALTHKCGAPACMLGHADKKWSAEVHMGDDHDFFAVTGEEWIELFGGQGCGDAGNDWRKAVDYVREFVSKREAALGEVSANQVQ